MTLEVTNKKCRDCGITKPLSRFGKDSARLDGYRSYCKECISIRNKDWNSRNTDYRKEYNSNWLRDNPDYHSVWHKEDYALNADTRREASRRWAKKNREKRRLIEARYRTRKKQLFVEDFTLEQILERDGLGCAWCGVVPEAYHVDHVRPLAHQGVHAPFNLVASCPSCNSSKRNADPAVWLARGLSRGLAGIPSQSALKGVRLAYSGLHEELKSKIDSKKQMALAA